MPTINITEKEVGKIIGTSQDFPTGNALSNGDAYLNFSRGAFIAEGPKGTKSVFQLNSAPTEQPQKYMSVSGAEGKDNVLILPGKASDYKAQVAQAPQGLGHKQKFGDVTFTDKAGNNIHTTNITAVVFLDGKQPNRNDMINDLYSKKLAVTDTKPLHDKAFGELSPMDQCKHKALTSDEFAKAYSNGKVVGGEQLKAAQTEAIAKSSKSCAR